MTYRNEEVKGCERFHIFLMKQNNRLQAKWCVTGIEKHKRLQVIFYSTETKILYDCWYLSGFLERNQSLRLFVFFYRIKRYLRHQLIFQYNEFKHHTNVKCFTIY